MSGRPVPWASWDEWLAVRDDLWSSDPQRQDLGLQHVCAWRLRGKLPLGVDITSHLMDVRRADAEWQRAVAWAAASAAAADAPAADATVSAGELPLRLRYSLPLIRLVNGISDSQQRGRVASSVAVLSDAAGLPRALVDVRHEATHNELPSLPLLRAAADSALAWLWDNYWEGQSRALAAAAERIGSLLTCLANSWRAATAAGLSGSAGALAAAAEAAAEEDDDEGGDTDGDAAGGYSGSEGQRLRRQAMSDLRSMLPPAFTQELLQPILDCRALLPPEPPAARAAAAAAAPPQREFAAQQQQREVVDARAWRSTMKQLLKWYPRLRPLLLRAALGRLTALAPAAPLAPATGPTPPDEAAAAEQTARVCAVWVLRLLPASALALEPASAASALMSAQASRLGSPSKKQGRGFGAPSSAAASKGAAKKMAAAATSSQGGAAGNEIGGGFDGGGGGDAAPDGPLGLPQLRELLAIATLGAATDVVAAPPVAAAGGLAVAAPWEGLAGPRQRALEDVVAALQRAIAEAGAAGRGGAKRPKASAAAVAGPLNAGEPPNGGGGGEQEVACPAAEGGGDDGDEEEEDAGSGDAKRQRQQWPHQPQEPQQLPMVSGQTDPRVGLPRRRWQRCTEWSRSAIGCLPCPLNPNGRIPPLLASLPPLMAAARRSGAGAVTAGDAVAGLLPGDGAAEAQAGAVSARATTQQGFGEDDDDGGYYMEPLEPLEEVRLLETNGPAAKGASGGDYRDEVATGSGRGAGALPGMDGDGESPPAGAAAASLFGTLLQQQQQQQSAPGVTLAFLL